MLNGLGCIGLGCMGALTSEQKTKADAMQTTLNNYLARLNAYLNAGARDVVEDAWVVLTNGVDKFWTDVNRDQDWETALRTYRGLTEIAEKAIAAAQQKIPYSLPTPAPTVPTAPPSQTRVADMVAMQSMQEAQAVAQQSAATQAAYAPYIAPQYMGMMMAAAQAQGMMNAQQAAQQATQQRAQQEPRPAAKPMNTWLVVGAAVAGLAVLYFAFKK